MGTAKQQTRAAKSPSQFAMHLGARFISDIGDTEMAEAAQGSMVADADALILKMREKVEPGMFADYLGGEDPFYEGAAQTEALAVLDEVQANLHAKASECSHELYMANRFRVLATGASAAMDDIRHYEAMLAILNRGVGSVQHVTGHLLNRGTVAGLATPAHLGYRV